MHIARLAAVALLCCCTAAAAPPATAPVSFLGVKDRAARVAIVISANFASTPDNLLWDEVQKCVEGLTPDQSFNFLYVLGEAYVAMDRDELLPATPENRRRAYSFIGGRIGRRPATGLARSLGASLLREAAQRTRPGIRRGLLEAAVAKLDRPKPFEMDALPRPLRKHGRKLGERFLQGLDPGGHRPDFAVERAIAMGPEVIYLFDDCTGDDDRMMGMELYEACKRLNRDGKVRFHAIALVDAEDLKEPLAKEALADVKAQLNGGTFTMMRRDPARGLKRVAAQDGGAVK